ncbi:hypothetical protein OPKNFCMD_4786 [Methylobacterium crusticola]|uniref:BA14K family protein n=1 Tax=Methylobacterium crusticola TaxID=1697972 RepID=A0ABQ4R5E5_9HYPH|nr:hypothetical protein [Methylobacterium crusticola]GJD52024.1 hypothetical protein OPKNFCMD_4786 [Methylobacterium crusticola]
MRVVTNSLAAGLLAGLLGLGAALPAAAQSVGYVTGFPGRDPAGDEEIGWGPAYRPETSFSQPGVPPTPGDFAGAAYRARTGRGPYDAVQGGPVRGVGYGGAVPGPRYYGAADGDVAPRRRAAPRTHRPVHARAHRSARQATR